jgi:hypothetical protein
MYDSSRTVLWKRQRARRIDRKTSFGENRYHLILMLLKYDDLDATDRLGVSRQRGRMSLILWYSRLINVKNEHEFIKFDILSKDSVMYWNWSTTDIEVSEH